MVGKHAYCADCGTKIKLELAQDSDNWKNTDEGWLCPHDNPDSDVSWGNSEE